MRIAHIRLSDGSVTYAVQVDGDVIFQAIGDIFKDDFHITDEVVEAAEWLPPVVPWMIMGIGRNFSAHAAEQGVDAPEYPILFMKNACAATGHLQPIRIPSVCDNEVDYEGELAVVIGKPALNVSKDDALDYVLGYTAVNDISSRIWQFEKGGSQWCRSKSYNTFAPMGPVLVTADEVGDPQGLSIRTSLNGEVVQDGNTKDMIFDVATIISFLSQDTTLLPGTIILTGTPKGIGWARDPKLMLKPGDEVKVEVEKIGCLINRVEAT